MSTLPVPSKGALRALRHIAIGTSCTVAFATGVVAEDRRRRIHSAQEVHDNAKRIKASRKYHSTGTTITATFDEQVMNYGDFCGPLKVGTKSRSTDTQQNEHVSDFNHIKGADGQERGAESVANQETIPNASQTSILKHRSNRSSALNIPSAISRSNVNERHETRDAPSPFHEEFDPQQNLAHRITHLIRRGTDEQTLNEAVKEITTSIADGMDVNVVGKPLQAAYQSLLQGCQDCKKPEIYIAVLENMLTRGPMQEESFYALGGISLMKRLLHESGFRIVPEEAVKAESIRRAATIFLAEYKNKPAFLSRDVLLVGHRLCTAARFAHLDDLSIAMFWRLKHILGSTPKDNVPDLIHAECHGDDWRSAQKHFLRFHTDSSLAQIPFYSMISTLVDSTLRAKTMDGLVDVLRAATDMAVSLNLVTSTTWFLKYFQALWDTSEDFPKIEAAFNQLEPLFEHTSHPQAIYTIMIQMCVNAGQDSAHLKYRDKLNELTGPNLRSLGHMALAKAKKGDWDGVEEDFASMRDLSLTHSDLYASVFTPILSVYIATHDLCETESFVKSYIQRHKVTPSQYVSNMMINMYAKNGEFDAIMKWLDYVGPFGCKLDAVSLNSMLSSCRSKWNMPLDQLLKLCHHMTETDAGLIDRVTLKILNRAASADANGDANLAGRYRKQIEILGEGLQCSNATPSRGNIADAIEEAHTKGKFHMVIKLYKQAFQSKMHIKANIIAMAVNASLKTSNDGNIREPTMLLKDAKARGFDISTAMAPLLLFQMENFSSNAESVESMVNRIVPVLQKQGLSLSPAAVSKATSILVSRGKFRSAVEFWGTLVKDQPELSHKIDVVNLTVLLKAYIGLSDGSGIQWVMSTLSRNDLLPDARFKLVLKGALKDARRRLNSNPSDGNSRRLIDILGDCLEFVLGLRSQGLLELREAEVKTKLIMQSAAKVRAGAGDASTARMTIVNQPLQRQPSTGRLSMDVGRQKGRVKLADAPSSTWPRVDAEMVYEGGGHIEESMPRVAATAAG